MTIQKVSNQEVVISGTWNSASAYNGVIIDIRDLSSNINSDLLDLRLNGVTKANITKGGMINTTSSVSALGTIYANSLSATTYANLPVSSRVAGSNTQVQFNANGAFGADANFTYTSSTATLNVGTQINTSILTTNDIIGVASPAANINLIGDTHSIEITPDTAQGSGKVAVLGNFYANSINSTTLSAVTISATTYLNAAGGTPGGANTQVQFNNNGTFSGTSGFTYDNATTTLTAPVVSATTYNNIGPSVASYVAATSYGTLYTMVRGLVYP